MAVLHRDDSIEPFEALDGQRAAIVLHYYRGLTLPEIAEILGVPVGTVRSGSTTPNEPCVLRLRPMPGHQEGRLA